MIAEKGGSGGGGGRGVGSSPVGNGGGEERSTVSVEGGIYQKSLR